MIESSRITAEICRAMSTNNVIGFSQLTKSFKSDLRNSHVTQMPRVLFVTGLPVIFSGNLPNGCQD
jgi:hypothetical protein